MNAATLQALARQLTEHEGYRDRPYRDSEGHLTIGVGHNLDAKPLSARVIALILDEDIADALADLDTHYPWWRSLDDVRMRVLADMSFNLGGRTLLDFAPTFAEIEAGRYGRAANRLRRTKWAKQVGRRARRLIRMLETGAEAPLDEPQ